MKKIITLLLTLTMIVSIGTTALAVDYGAEYQNLPTPQTVQKFSDVPSTHWAFDYIGEMAQRDVISGYPDGRFLPENQVTRAEFAKIMVCAAGLRVNNNNTTSFTDVYTSDWYCPYVECAKDYLTGYATSAGTIYKPTTPALREDIAVALVKLKGYDISLADESILNMFTDSYSISASARKYVAVAVERGIVSGYEDNTFRGQATITRAEAATLLWRAFQYGNDNKVVEAQPNIEPTPGQTQTTSQEKTYAEATAKPTEKPVATPQPEPTEEPTPEPTEKPYKVDTLVKANISDSDNIYSYTGSDDSIYCIENNKIIKVDIASKDKEEILDTKDLTIDNDEYTLDDFEISSICCDKYQDSLLIQGKYKTVNSASKKNNCYLYEVKGKDIAVITDDFYTETPIIGILSNGDYVTTGSIISSEDFSWKDRSWGNLMEEVDDKLYYLATVSGYGYGSLRYELVSYDYINTDEVWGKVLQDLPYGMSDQNYVIVGNNNIIFYNFNGKEIKKIAIADCTVIDKTAFEFSNAARKLLITDNDDIIFYDKSAKAFRMISENK